MMKHDIETPAVLIDAERMEANLARAQRYADAHGLALRPHIKTHKIPRFARRQLDLGAAGITCQKLGEAEVMADSDICDILLTYNIVGARKLARLAVLARRVELKVTADNAAVVDGYAEAFKVAPAPLIVLVECDTGMGRCGVQAPQEALALAQRIDAAAGLAFGGLMTYPAAAGGAQAVEWLDRAEKLFQEAGLATPVISSGGTPDLWSAHTVTAVTEHRPGTYIYMDRSQAAAGACTLDECALSVLTTVVSAPTADRIVLDAGSKTLSSDTLGLEGFGYIPTYPGAIIKSLSEEHAVVDLSACTEGPEIGATVEIIPNHACVVSNLFDHVHLVYRNGQAEKIAVAARGRVD